MEKSLQYTQNKKKSPSGGRINTFFPSFIGLALWGNDLFVCEATKRFGTKFKSGTVKDFLSRNASKLRSNLEFLKGKQRPVILSWPREKTTVRELYVEAQDLKKLRKTLGSQLDSLFPFKPGEAYFDLYPCNSPDRSRKSTGERKVYLFAINRKELDDVIGRLEILGLRPSRVIPSPLAFLPMLNRKSEGVVCLHRIGNGEYVYNFYNLGVLLETHICNEEKLKQNLREEPPSAVFAIGFEDDKLPRKIIDAIPKRVSVAYLDPSWESSGAAIYEAHSHSYDFQFLRPSKRKVNYQNLYLASLLLLILSLLVAIPQISQIRDQRRLVLVDAEIAGLKGHAFALEKLNRIAMSRKALNAIANSQKGYVSRADILLELATILPENTWIKGLSVKKNIFEIEGFAASLSETMFLLEDASIFSNVELIPPLVKDKDGMEHFRLKGNLLREKTDERS